MEKVCFIVVNYFGASETYNMYLSLLNDEVSSDSFDFIIVDNSEDSDEFSNLCSLFYSFKNVSIIRADKNLGYFSGLNLGISRINPSEYSYVVISNNDLLFDFYFLPRLLDRKYGYPDIVYAVCPDVVTLDGVHQNPHVEKRYSLLKKLKLDLYYSNFFISKALRFLSNLTKKKSVSGKEKVAKEVHLGIGAIYILTPSFFGKNSALNYPFFLYGEEAFLSNQIHISGGVLLYDPSLVVHHNFSAATSKIPSKVKFFWAKESYKVHRKYL